MSSKKGFTLTELLLAVSIMAVLVGVSVPKYTQYKAKGRRAECLSMAPGIVKIGSAFKSMHPQSLVPIRIWNGDDSQTSPSGFGGQGTIKFIMITDTKPSVDRNELFYSYGISPGSAFYTPSGVMANYMYPVYDGSRNRLEVVPASGGFLLSDPGNPYNSRDVKVYCYGAIAKTGCENNGAATCFDGVMLTSAGEILSLYDQILSSAGSPVKNEPLY